MTKSQEGIDTVEHAFHGPFVIPPRDTKPPGIVRVD
jgi:hypothetical protein